MKKNIAGQYLKGASPWYFIAAILVITVVLGGLIVYLLYFVPGIKGPGSEKEKSEVEKQLEELENLGKDVEPLTEEEIQKQAEELDNLGRDVEPLTEEEIQKQLEELENL